MRNGLATAIAALVALGAGLQALNAGQESGRPEHPRLAQRFPRLGTNRPATIKKELDAAAAAGYRVVAGVGLTHLALEKASLFQSSVQILKKDSTGKGQAIAET